MKTSSAVLVRLALLASLPVSLACRDTTVTSSGAGQSSADVTAPVVLPEGPYEIVDLGTLGGTTSSATDINERGEVVGFSQVPGGTYHAFLWARGVMRDLGTLGGDVSTADDINSVGQVAGRSTTATGEWRAFRWEDGKMQDLGPAVPAGFTLYPTAPPGTNRRAINKGGEVVWTAPVGEGATHGFLWREGIARDLGTLGGSSSDGPSINDRGQVAGSSETAEANARHYFLWEDSNMRDLGGPGSRLAWIAGMNKQGHVAGTSQFPVSPSRAFLWDGTELRDIGTLPPYTSADAIAINDSGQVVANALYWDYEGFFEPFLWDHGVIRPLSPPSSLARQEAAVAMNATGVVAGYRITHGRHPSLPMPRAVVWEIGLKWDLGTLGGSQSRPVAINNRGDVVGWSSTAEGPIHAVLWRRIL